MLERNSSLCSAERPRTETLPCRRGGEACEQAQQRRLAGTIRADERRDMALGDQERAFLERPQRPVALAEPRGLDGGGSEAQPRSCDLLHARVAQRALHERLDGLVVHALGPGCSRSIWRGFVASRAWVPGGGPLGRRETNVPTPWRPSTRPSCSSSQYAFITVLGLIATSATTSFTVGSLSPTSSRPIRIACLTCWTICQVGRYARAGPQMKADRLPQHFSSHLVKHSDPVPVLSRSQPRRK